MNRSISLTESQHDLLKSLIHGLLVSLVPRLTEEAQADLRSLVDLELVELISESYEVTLEGDYAL